MEREIITWLRSHFAARPPVELGIGDDAAVVCAPSPRIVLTTDAIIDQVHFDLRHHRWELIGRKAIAVNLSDLAAMGAEPLVVLVALVLPRHTQLADVQALFAGVQSLCNDFEVQLIGGDTNVSDGPLVVSVTAGGLLTLDQVAWTLSGARPGDEVLVSGELGGSIFGKHLQFEPRCALASYLAKHYPIHAGTDISDGLVIDLAKMCRASGCGAELDLSSIPVSSAARSKEEDFDGALNRALYDGEDFELLLAVEPSIAARLLQDPQLPTPLTRIGRFTENAEITGRQNGRTTSLAIRGYEHGRAS